MTVPVDWAALRAAAADIARRAYMPYSHFPVGAAGSSTTGASSSAATSRTPRTA